MLFFPNILGSEDNAVPLRSQLLSGSSNRCGIGTALTLAWCFGAPWQSRVVITKDEVSKPRGS